MRILLAVIVALGLAYGGYWFVGAGAVERGAVQWFDDRQSEGWVADYSGLNTTGFPNRFDTTVRDLTLADPETGVAWTAPFFQLFALSYAPNKVIAIWPDTQQLSSPFTKVAVTSDVMRASAEFQADTTLALDRATAEMKNVVLRATSGWEMALDDGLLAVRQTVGENTYDLFFEAKGLQPDEALRLSIRADPPLPDRFETLSLEAVVSFDAPWDRFAIETARPQPTQINLKNAQGTWGQLDLRAAGALEIGPDGTPKGKITVKAKNWRDMVRIAVDNGLVPAGSANTITRGLELLAGLSGNPETLDLPITFGDRFMSLGPIPLGPSPKIRLR